MPKRFGVGGIAVTLLLAGRPLLASPPWSLADTGAYTDAAPVPEATENTEKAPDPSGDYFETFPSVFRIKAIAELPFYSFYLGAPNIKGVAYLPSFGPHAGANVTYKGLGAMATFALPIPETERYRRGTSAQTDLIFSTYWRQHGLDTYYQAFRGFYVSSPFRELSVHKPARYPQLPDAQVKNFGFNWYYSLDPNHYSLRAAFDEGEFQLRSGGSLLFNPFYNHLEISLGSVFLPGIGDNSVQGIPNLASGKIDSLGVSAGYGYSFVFGRYFISGQGAVGPAGQIQNIRPSAGSNEENFSLALKINVNAAAGWNGKEYLLGVKFLLDSLSSRVADTEFASNLISAQAFLGKRF